jgi:hypothetical protein
MRFALASALATDFAEAAVGNTTALHSSEWCRSVVLPALSGSYVHSCRQCSVSSPCILSCDCADGYGGEDHTTYNLNDCSNVRNNHGKLQCDEAYSQTCAVHPACAAAGLAGDCCPTSDGVTLGCCSSHLEVMPNATVPDATEFVMDNATVLDTIEYLGCPNSGGSYVHSCRHCSVSSSCILSCDCADGYGGEDYATYDLHDCNDVRNNHGKLQCDEAHSHSCAVHPACAAAGLAGDCCPTSDGVTLGCCSSHSEVMETSYQVV